MSVPNGYRSCRRGNSHRRRIIASPKEGQLMSDQVPEDREDAILSHEADIDAGYDDDEGDNATDGPVAGSDLPADTAPPTSHEADVDAGFDGAGNSAEGTDH
jgi:hypothetical protein